MDVSAGGAQRKSLPKGPGGPGKVTADVGTQRACNIGKHGEKQFCDRRQVGPSERQRVEQSSGTPGMAFLFWIHRILSVAALGEVKHIKVSWLKRSPQIHTFATQSPRRRTFSLPALPRTARINLEPAPLTGSTCEIHILPQHNSDLTPK